MNPNLQTILAELKQSLTELYGDRLDRLILYGSQARGDAAPDSDVDVLVVLKGTVNRWQEVFRTEDAISSASLKSGVLISPLFISENEYRRVDEPLIGNVRAEGIKL